VITKGRNLELRCWGTFRLLHLHRLLQVSTRSWECQWPTIPQPKLEIDNAFISHTTLTPYILKGLEYCICYRINGTSCTVELILNGTEENCGVF